MISLILIQCNILEMIKEPVMFVVICCAMAA